MIERWADPIGAPPERVCSRNRSSFMTRVLGRKHALSCSGRLRVEKGEMARAVLGEGCGGREYMV